MTPDEAAADYEEAVVRTNEALALSAESTAEVAANIANMSEKATEADPRIEALIERVQQAALQRAQAKFLIRRAGQMDQAERARLGIPSRSILRANLAMSKPGRKGRKARARAAREAKQKGLG